MQCPDTTLVYNGKHADPPLLRPYLLAVLISDRRNLNPLQKDLRFRIANHGFQRERDGLRREARDNSRGDGS